jgi:hypothetical protein
MLAGSLFRRPIIRPGVSTLAGMMIVMILSRSASAEIRYDDRFQSPMTFVAHLDPFSNETDQIFATGLISSGSEQELQSVLDKNHVKAGVTVYFHSPGGDAAEGMAIGRLIRARQLSTSIGQAYLSFIDPGECDSACSLAFLGGIQRDVVEGSRYGVHNAALNDPGSVKNQFAVGQAQAAAESSFYSEMGVDPRLLELKNQFDSSAGEIAYASPDDMVALRITTKLETAWELTLQDGKPVLVGKTADGAGGADVLQIQCAVRHAVMTASYRLRGRDLAVLRFKPPALVYTPPGAAKAPPTISMADLNSSMDETSTTAQDFVYHLIGLGWQKHPGTKVGPLPDPDFIDIDPNEIISPAQLNGADRISATIMLTGHLVDYLRTADALYFSFHEARQPHEMRSNAGFSSNIAASRKIILDMIGSCG